MTKYLRFIRAQVPLRYLYTVCWNRFFLFFQAKEYQFNEHFGTIELDESSNLSDVIHIYLSLYWKQLHLYLLLNRESSIKKKTFQSKKKGITSWLWQYAYFFATKRDSLEIWRQSVFSANKSSSTTISKRYHLSEPKIQCIRNECNTKTRTKSMRFRQYQIEFRMTLDVRGFL